MKYLTTIQTGLNPNSTHFNSSFVISRYDSVSFTYLAMEKFKMFNKITTHQDVLTNAGITIPKPPTPFLRVRSSISTVMLSRRRMSSIIVPGNATKGKETVLDG